jgi:hypothetical protein
VATSSSPTLTFCLPIGTDKLIYSSCDKLDWVNNKFIVASANPVVSAQFGVTNTTSGYEFWFFDPNGTTATVVSVATPPAMVSVPVPPAPATSR